MRLKHCWFHLKLNSVFQDLSRRSIGTGFWRFSDAVKILEIRPQFNLYSISIYKYIGGKKNFSGVREIDSYQS